MEFIPAMKEECGDSHFDDYNFSSNSIDKININGKSKCGEIYILENDLFSFLCTLCDSPFEEIENLFVHVKGKHTTVTRKNESITEKDNEYMDSGDDNFLYKDVKIEIHGQDTSNDEIKSTIQEEDDGQMSTTLKSEILKMKICSAIDNDCQDDNDEDNTVLSDLFKISKSTFKKQGVKRKPNKSNVKSKNNKEKRKPETKDKPVCDICNKTFASRKGVRRHKIYRHTSFVNIPESLKCSFCHRHFEDSSKRADHERVHTGERPYQCQVCGKCFRTKAVCMNHEISHSNIRQFQCEICNLAFKNRSDLYMHTQRHGEKKFKCTYCEKSFFKNSERSRHERSHTDLKPFKCTFCEKSFKSSSSLKIHSRTHTGIRPYQCEYCDKSFGTKAILDNHVVVHTGERPFVCNICNATFPRKKALKSHEKIHSDARAYVCKICGEAFKLYQGLYSHMHKHGKSIVKNKINE